MMEQLSDKSIYIIKGTPFPFLCPSCDAVVPYNQNEMQKCWACNYEGLVEEFNVEWKFIPSN